ncbi:hypothetical protein BB559_002948 [Furculomyces boomerangus]|uniref:MRN complex-interacting protein N-terminal domain-containing protein n=1 Tax=Furculomyces boomerangus TaxID=61424 RepID=A0A2T9YQK6_9FUNG|nr:hypothetical protein BB559_002948 [Furculomyces boomerangus]
MVVHQVLKCAFDQCGTFQVQQKKKLSKWSCKVCGEKQSLIKVFFESSTAPECRKVVQELNRSRGELEIAYKQHTLSTINNYNNIDPECENNKLDSSLAPVFKKPEQSIWSKFDKGNESVSDSESDDFRIPKEKQSYKQSYKNSRHKITAISLLDTNATKSFSSTKRQIINNYKAPDTRTIQNSSTEFSNKKVRLEHKIDEKKTIDKQHTTNSTKKVVIDDTNKDNISKSNTEKQSKWSKFVQEYSSD